MSENSSLPSVKNEVTIEKVLLTFKGLRESNKKLLNSEILKTIEDHPFVEITDTKTLSLAKKSRTAFKTVRTSIANGDKVLAGIFSRERKEQISIKNELTTDVLVYETKQQSEIDRWDNLKAEKKALAEKAEKERIENINLKIKEVKESANSYLDNCVFSTIDETQESLELLFKIDYDFEEYDVLFDELEEEINFKFDLTVEKLNDLEGKRLQSVLDAQKSKYNECKLYAFETLEDATVSDLDLHKTIENYFNSISFDFGDLQESFLLLRDASIFKASKKVSDLKEQALKDAEFKKLKAEKVASDRRENARVLEAEKARILKENIEAESEDILKFKNSIDVDIKDLNKYEFNARSLNISSEIGSFTVKGYCSENKEYLLGAKNDLNFLLSEKVSLVKEQIKQDEIAKEKIQSDRIERLKADKEYLIEFIDDFKKVYDDAYIGENHEPETLSFYDSLNSSFSEWVKEAKKSIENY